MKTTRQASCETLAPEILCDRGRTTPSELYEEISKSGKAGYTNVLERMQRMEENSSVKIATKQGRTNYRDAFEKPVTTKLKFVSHLTHNTFDD